VIEASPEWNAALNAATPFDQDDLARFAPGGSRHDPSYAPSSASRAS